MFHYTKDAKIILNNWDGKVKKEAFQNKVQQYIEDKKLRVKKVLVKRTRVDLGCRYNNGRFILKNENYEKLEEEVSYHPDVDMLVVLQIPERFGLPFEVENRNDYPKDLVILNFVWHSRTRKITDSWAEGTNNHFIFYR